MRKWSLLAACLVVGCEPLPEEAKPTVTRTEIKGGSLRTIRHDDHTFVVAVASDPSGISISLIHHPACPMEKGNQ